MEAAEALKTLEQIRIVPVVVSPSVDSAHAVAVTLRDSGVATAEVALRTPDAIPAIQAMANVEGFIVGAGTVLRPGDAEVAVAAGASYLVSPGFDERLTRFAIDIGVPFIPGVASATEVQHALSSGLTHLKLFPAGLLGGLDLINAFAGPFPESRFMPSGGVSAANVTDYLSSDSVFAVSGSWMVPTHAVMTNDMETISRLTSQAAAARGR